MRFDSDAPVFRSTFDAWQHLLDLATQSVDLAVFYWTLRPSDTNTTDASTKPVTSNVSRPINSGITGDLGQFRTLNILE